MTVYQHEGYPSIFACTVDGYCNIISYKKNEQGGELIVTSKVDICFRLFEFSIDSGIMLL